MRKPNRKSKKRYRKKSKYGGTKRNREEMSNSSSPKKMKPQDDTSSIFSGLSDFGEFADMSYQEEVDLPEINEYPVDYEYPDELPMPEDEHEQLLHEIEFPGNMEYIEASPNAENPNGGKKYYFDGNDSFISSGGYGKVFRVYKEGDETRRYALKIVPKSRTATIFQNEIDVLRFLQPSCANNILCYHDSFVDTLGRNCIVTEYLGEYISLDRYINLIHTRIPGEDQKDTFIRLTNIFTKLISELSSGLKLIHIKRVSHRDIRPENIMVYPITDIKDIGLLRVKYIDFSSAYRGGVYVKLDNKSPHYRDPDLKRILKILENLKNENMKKKYRLRIFQQADLFSLGIIIYNIINNMQPPILVHKDEIQKIIEQAKLKNPKKIKDIDLEKIIRADTQKDRTNLQSFNRTILRWIMRGKIVQNPDGSIQENAFHSKEYDDLIKKNIFLLRTAQRFNNISEKGKINYFVYIPELLKEITFDNIISERNLRTIIVMDHIPIDINAILQPPKPKPQNPA